MFAQRADREKAFFASRLHTAHGFERGDNPASLEQEDRSGVAVSGLVLNVFARRKLGKGLTILCGHTLEILLQDEQELLEKGEAVEVVCSADISESAAAVAKTVKVGARVAIHGDFEAARNRIGRWKVRASVVVQEQEASAQPTSSNAPKTERHLVFAAWILENFGLSTIKSVVDVAGGRGLLSSALLKAGAESAVVIEPVERVTKEQQHGEEEVYDDTAPSDKISVVRELVNEFGNAASVAEALDDASIVVALHPDEATEAAVCVAAARKLPFAVIPCCVFPNLFSQRRQFWHFDPEKRRRRVKTHQGFVEFLVQRAHALGCEARTAVLPFQGKNVVVYWTRNTISRTLETTEDDQKKSTECALRVCAFLDVHLDLISGGVRCVSKDWAYAAGRMVQTRLGEATKVLKNLITELQTPTCRVDLREDIDEAEASMLLSKLESTVRCAGAEHFRATLGGDPSLFPLAKRAKNASEALRVFAAVHASLNGPLFIGKEHGAFVLFCRRAGLALTLQISSDDHSGEQPTTTRTPSEDDGSQGRK